MQNDSDSKMIYFDEYFTTLFKMYIVNLNFLMFVFKINIVQEECTCLLNIVNQVEGCIPGNLKTKIIFKYLKNYKSVP